MIRPPSVKRSSGSRPPESASMFTRFPLYATDDQLARIILGDEDARLWNRLVGELDRDGLPPPRALFGNRRYLPAVLHYLARREGLLDSDGHGFADDGGEYFE